MTDKPQRTLFDIEPTPWEMDDAAHRLVAVVALAVAPWGPFDYAVPEKLRGRIEPGRRVRVPLGRGNRVVTGYCVELADRPPGRPLKEVQTVLDERPLLSSTMLKLTRWMADYYLSPWGQTLETVVPAGVRGQAGTRETTYLSIPPKFAATWQALKLPEKQAKAMQVLAQSHHALTPPQLAGRAGCTQAPISALRKAGLIHAEVRREQHVEVAEERLPREENLLLNEDQTAAFQSISKLLNERQHGTVLLHGVTGSGKTEVYIRAIEQVLSYGRQAIVLVPEISLTPQTRQRFRSRFDHVAVLHSNMSDSERHWHWQQIASGRVQVVVGARSAVFAPTPQLGLIILDEEHDGSFKQDSSPRYHARDVALRRAALDGVPLVLGSATPSLESWRLAQENEFQLVEMPRRVLDLPMPDVATIDLRVEFKNRNNRGAVSRQLSIAMEQALKEGGQVILLLNRRGYSTHIQCPACGKTVSCDNCNIALTHHKDGEKVVCHYCDYSAVTPTRCPECGFDGIRFSGLGTQRLEMEVKARFPKTPCLRMDSDTMQKPGSHEKALDEFRSGKVKILLGTQMISKGLDFPNVTLVGVINADTALHIPDFRAAERTFQLVTQVAGRTGRGMKGGRVLVQTFTPEHPAIAAATRHDFLGFAAAELPIRQDSGYPPYVAMVRIIVRGECEPTTDGFAVALADSIRKRAESQSLTLRVLGPSAAPLSRLRNLFRFHMLLLSADGDALRRIVSEATAALEPRDDVQYMVDVDPIDML